MKPAVLRQYEQRFWAQQLTVVGVDEVGRGAFAGPVTVGAVMLDPDVVLVGVRDSKTLSARRRSQFTAAIQRDAACWAIGDASAAEIDAVGLTGALQRAAKRALAQLEGRYDAILLDGRHDFIRAAAPTTLVVKGDQVSESIAAASIVAKTHRDTLMTAYHADYPEYGFAQHKGYGSQAHRDALEQHGVCPLHRRSFAPCADQLQLTLGPTVRRQSRLDPDRR